VTQIRRESGGTRKARTERATDRERRKGHMILWIDKYASEKEGTYDCYWGTNDRVWDVWVKKYQKEASPPQYNGASRCFDTCKDVSILGPLCQVYSD
jgi:hypothetical protein